MSDWTSGYVADIGYTHGFYRELTPSLLGFVALSKGSRSPLEPNAPTGLTFCELGCGQGFSTNLLAAANPHIAFYATDFNPGQIAGAKQLAAEAGTTNAHFYDDSFEEFRDNPDLPSFDVIVLHGIYSWISAENRAHIMAFIKAKLKPGGLVYISYNTLPGWAAAMPLRRIMVDEAARSAGPIAPRIDRSIDFMKRINEVGSVYFAQNPTVYPRVEKMAPMSRNYLAHEYFNRDWTPFYFGDVAQDLREAKATFLGSANLLDHVEAISFSDDQIALINETGDPLRAEAVRDILVNQQFRRDVFIRGAVPLSTLASRELWGEMRFALSVDRANVSMKVKSARGEVTLNEDTYAPILDGLSKGPAALKALADMPGLEDFSWSRFMQALIVLVGAGSVEPCLPAKDEGKRNARVRAFNNAVMKRAETSDELRYLASPITGGGITVDRFSQIFMSARTRKDKLDPAEQMWSILQSQGQRLVFEGKTLETDEENLTEIRKRYEKFEKDLLPIYRSLGIATI